MTWCSSLDRCTVIASGRDARNATSNLRMSQCISVRSSWTDSYQIEIRWAWPALGMGALSFHGPAFDPTRTSPLITLLKPPCHEMRAVPGSSQSINRLAKPYLCLSANRRKLIACSLVGVLTGVRLELAHLQSNDSPILVGFADDRYLPRIDLLLIADHHVSWPLSGAEWR